MAKFKVNGLRELQKELTKMERSVPREAERELKSIADGILADAVSRVHVRSGELKASAFIEKIEGGWMIGFSASYSGYEEFGTGALTEIPLGADEDARKFFVSGRGFQPAHPFLFPAFLARRDGIVDELEVKIRDFVSRI